jgi:hypothetical protein
MARTCQGMMEKTRIGLVMMIPGIVFIARLAAAVCILAGGAMLVMANFMRGAGARLRSAGD